MSEKQKNPCRGISLLEILVALTLLGVLIYGAIHFLSYFTKFTSIQTSKGELAILTASLDRVFSDQITCQNAFRSDRVANTRADMNLSIPIVGTIVAGSPSDGIISRPLSIASRGAPVAVVDQKVGVYSIREITIIRNGDPTGISGGRWSWDVTLNVTFTPNKTVKEKGATEKIQKFALSIITAAVGAGVATVPIDTCTTNERITAQTMCGRIIGGFWDGNNCQILLENRATDPAAPQPGQLWLRTGP